MRCAIWYYLCNLKNVKNTHGGVLLFVLKVTLLHGCFSRFINCTNGTQLHNASESTFDACAAKRMKVLLGHLTPLRITHHKKQ